ncbi:MAG: BatD family protein [Verrucomicrobia bacterium]|nr:BatD family protein [Verrucomicrobiota bacterium]
MRRLFSLCFALLLGLTAAAEDRVSWEITPRITAPGQPFRLQIIVESDVVLGGAQQAGKEIRPPRGMALRLSGQIVRSDSNEATINYSGVAPEQEGEYIIPAFNLRFARKMIAVEPIKLTVSKSVAYRRTAQARAELAIPDRTFYVGELIRGSIRMRGGEDETVVASFGLESVAEGFTLSVTADRQPLPEELGQGMQTTFELTPIREGVSELALNGTMLIQGAAVSAFSNSGRDRPFAFRRKLTIEHVPERGRPADWSGAIGTFAAEAVQVSKDKPEVGEPIRLRAILTGTGNLDRLITPEIPGSEQWDILPAQERRRHSEEQRFFVYTLVPRLPGKLLTPAIRFSTFDPLTKKYSRVEFKPIEVVVTGTAPAKVDLITADPAAPADSKQKTVTGLATPEPRRSSALFLGTPSAPLAASASFWSGNGLLVVLLIALTATTLYLGYLAAHPEIRIRRRARSILRASLITAAKARLKSNQRAFALSVAHALQVGSAALLGAEEAAMTQSDIERALPGANRTLLDGLFLRAYGERFAAGAPDASAADDAAALELVRRLLALL